MMTEVNFRNNNIHNNNNVGPARACVSNSEIRGKTKKYTMYKLLVTYDGKTHTHYRRYSDFNKLHELLKKSYPELHLKFPGKKIFGNNFDPLFIRSRTEGLNTFIQKLVSDQHLFQNMAVRAFLELQDLETVDEQSPEEDTADETSDSNSRLSQLNERSVNLGRSEKIHAKPSDFEFLKVIGKGSFGKVLLAKHKCEGKLYAVKVLQKKTVLKRNEAHHIMSERNVLLKNLNHPFLVRLHYSFQTSNKLYFVLDYINGGELFFHLQQEKRFKEPRAMFYTAELASAIGYLHLHGIVYRDLKPENILIDSEGHIALTDFGLCKEGLCGSDTTSTFCGTPEYLAPEVLRRQAYDKSVDWWCLGGVLYEMLVGLPPFYSKNMSEMYDNILNKTLNLERSMSQTARDLLGGLLQKDQNQRLGSGKDDFEDIKVHPFFKTIDWDDLINKRIPPPYRPNLNGVMDLNNIDPEFTKEPIPASIGQSVQSITASVQDADTSAFDGFSYVATAYHLH